MHQRIAEHKTFRTTSDALSRIDGDSFDLIWVVAA